MAARTKLTLSAQLPDDLIGDFLQHVRDFDIAHPGCHFAMVASSELSLEEMQTILKNVDPPFAILDTHRKN